MNYDSPPVGRMVAELRTALGLSQARAAELRGAAGPTLARLEASESPGWQTLVTQVAAMGGQITVQVSHPELPLWQPISQTYGVTPVGITDLFDADPVRFGKALVRAISPEARPGDTAVLVTSHRAVTDMQSAVHDISEPDRPRPSWRNREEAARAAFIEGLADADADDLRAYATLASHVILGFQDGQEQKRKDERRRLPRTPAEDWLRDFDPDPMSDASLVGIQFPQIDMWKLTSLQRLSDAEVDEAVKAVRAAVSTEARIADLLTGLGLEPLPPRLGAKGQAS